MYSLSLVTMAIAPFNSLTSTDLSARFPSCLTSNKYSSYSIVSPIFASASFIPSSWRRHAHNLEVRPQWFRDASELCGRSTSLLRA